MTVKTRSMSSKRSNSNSSTAAKERPSRPSDASSKSVDAANESLKSAAKGASYNVLLQIVFRLATFVTNAVILRYATKELLGVVNVRLMLLYTTIIFLARESFIKACLSTRRDTSSKALWQGLVNLCWIAVPLGATWALVLASAWIQLFERPDMPYYDLAVGCFCLSAVLELLSLPVLVVEMIQLRVEKKAIAEGLAMGVKCTVTLMLMLWRPELGLLTACLAQLLHAVVYSGYLYLSVWRAIHRKQHPVFKSLSDTLPQGVGSLPWYRAVNQELANVAWSFFKHGILKQLLTEGERYLMTIFGLLSFSQQGVYDAIHNLGSLVARFFFHPIEENYYTFFAALLERHDGEDQENDSDDDDGSKRRPSMAVVNHVKASNDHEIQMACNTLQTLLKLMILVGATIAVFGQGYSQLLLHLYGGATLSDGEGPLLLQAYAGYVFFMSLNGITECFVAAASSQAEIEAHNRWMVVFSVAFVLVTGLFTSYVGSVGFIAANAVNMLLRTAHSVHVIDHYVLEQDEALKKQPHPLYNAIPNSMVVAAYGLSMMMTVVSQMQFLPDVTVAMPLRAALVHISVGVGSLLFVAASIYLEERAFLGELYQLFVGRQADKKKQ